MENYSNLSLNPGVEDIAMSTGQQIRGSLKGLLSLWGYIYLLCLRCIRLYVYSVCWFSLFVLFFIMGCLHTEFTTLQVISESLTAK